MIEENYWPSLEKQRPAFILRLQANANCMTLQRFWSGLSCALQNVQTRWNGNYYTFKKTKVLKKKASVLCFSDTLGKAEWPTINGCLQARRSTGTCWKRTCNSHTVSAVKFSPLHLKSWSGHASNKSLGETTNAKISLLSRGPNTLSLAHCLIQRIRAIWFQMAMKSDKPHGFYFFSFSDDIFKQSTKSISGISSGKLHHDNLLTLIIPTEATVSSLHSINRPIYRWASGKSSFSDHLVMRCCSTRPPSSRPSSLLRLATFHTSPHVGLQEPPNSSVTIPRMIPTIFPQPFN